MHLEMENHPVRKLIELFIAKFLDLYKEYIVHKKGQ